MYWRINKVFIYVISCIITKCCTTYLINCLQYICVPDDDTDAGWCLVQCKTGNEDSLLERAERQTELLWKWKHKHEKHEKPAERCAGRPSGTNRYFILFPLSVPVLWCKFLFVRLQPRSLSLRISAFLSFIAQ